MSKLVTSHLHPPFPVDLLPPSRSNICSPASRRSREYVGLSAISSIGRHSSQPTILPLKVKSLTPNSLVNNAPVTAVRVGRSSRTCVYRPVCKLWYFLLPSLSLLSYCCLSSSLWRASSKKRCPGSCCEP